MPSSFAAIQQRYLCIFFLSEADMLALCSTKKQADCLLNPPIRWFLIQGWYMVFRVDGCSESPALRQSHVNFSTTLNTMGWYLYKGRAPTIGCTFDLSRAFVYIQMNPVFAIELSIDIYGTEQHQKCISLVRNYNKKPYD